MVYACNADSALLDVGNDFLRMMGENGGQCLNEQL